MSNGEQLDAFLESLAEKQADMETAWAGGDLAPGKQPADIDFDPSTFQTLYLIQKGALVSGLLVKKGNVESSPEERIADIAEMPQEEVNAVLKDCASLWYARENLVVGLNNGGKSWLKKMRQDRPEETADLQADVKKKLAAEVNRDTIRRMSAEINHMREELYKYRLVEYRLRADDTYVNFYRAVDESDEEAVSRMGQELAKTEINIESVDGLVPDLFEAAIKGLEETMGGLELSIGRITYQLCQYRVKKAQESGA